VSWYSGEWQCDKCETSWESVVKSSDRDTQTCPTCQGEARRLLAAPAVLRVSFRDGTKRFEKLREQDKVDRALSEAQTFDDRKRLLIEKDRVAGSKHGDKT